MFAYVPGSDPAAMVSLVISAIEQELASDPRGCGRFGQLLGEKIAEELALLLPAARRSLAEVAAGKVLPVYFAVAPRCQEVPSSKPGTRAYNLLLTDLPLGKFCRFQGLLDLVHGVLVVLSQKLFASTVQVRKTRDGVVIIEPVAPVVSG